MREQVILSTKVGSHPNGRGYDRDTVLWSFDQSLKTLRTGYIDLLMVHDPPDMAPVMGHGGALETLEELKAQKAIGWIGLGQLQHDFHRIAIASNRFDVILTFMDYNPIRATAGEILRLAAERDIGVLQGSPLMVGLLTGGDPDSLPESRLQHVSDADLNAARRLYWWQEDTGITVRALTLQFCLRNPLIHCTLSGAKNASEFQDTLRQATASLPDWVWDDLEAMNVTQTRVLP